MCFFSLFGLLVANISNGGPTFSIFEYSLQKAINVLMKVSGLSELDDNEP